MRKLRNKLINIFLIFVAIVLHDLFQPLVKLKGQHVVLIDSIEYSNSFLKFGVSLIVVLENGRKRTGRERKSHYTDKHDYDTHRSLNSVLARDITVTHSCDSTDCEIKGSKIKCHMIFRVNNC